MNDTQARGVEQFIRDPREVDQRIAELEPQYDKTGVFPCGTGFVVFAENKVAE